ncbi:MAG: amidohydrolase [Deltaproteobacteria bacterium]|nr:amidohydrolase [Deltaproteobacteria bacterium]MBW2414929.1 amidohydrolase [Deltaproteobacteria bacterium]
MAKRSLFLNGRVLTLDAGNSVVEAVAVSEGRIEAVGSTADLREHYGGGANVDEIDLGGGTLIPGFVDAHSHVGMVGQLALQQVDLNSPPIGKAERMDDVVRLLADRARDADEGEWILGRGYDDTLLAEGRHPNRHDLDRASETRPIVVFHISGHFASANSLALERAGVTSESKDPVGGVIRREADGRPDGVLEESAMLPVMGALPPGSQEDRVDAFVHATRLYASRGITTAQHGMASSLDIADFDRGFEAGRIPISVVVWPNIPAMRELDSGKLAPRTDGDQLVIGAVKLFADGSIQGFTGHLCCPYHTPFKGQDDYRGYAAMPREQLEKFVTEIYASGRQVAVHVNGDAAIDDFLHAVDRAQRAYPRDDARPIAVHAQMTREDQLDEMQRLGVVPSFFVLHTYYWGDRHRDLFIGPERAPRISPTRSAAKRGLRFTIHTDAPVVPMTPMLLMWAAANRRTTSGKTLGPEQCLTPLEALRATTIDAAWQLHLEHDRGSIEPGKRADFALLGADPLGDPAALAGIEVESTFVAGRRVDPRL